MSNLVPIQQGHVAADWTADEIQLLKETVFRGLDEKQFKVACYISKAKGLNPILKQIHAVVRRDKNGNQTLTMQTGIDGFRLTAQRTGAYAGSDEPTFEMADERFPKKATVTVHKIVQGQRCAFTATAYWDEYAPDLGSKEGFFWKKMPKGQLAKCAETLALRKAFPAEMSNLYGDDEMHQADAPPAAVTGPSKANRLNASLQAKAPEKFVEADVVSTSPAEVSSNLQPENPKPAPPTADLDNFVIRVGKKYAGKTFKQVGKQALADFANWADQNINNKTADWNEFFDNVDAYLAMGEDVERGEIAPEPDLFRPDGPERMG